MYHKVAELWFFACFLFWIKCKSEWKNGGRGRERERESLKIQLLCDLCFLYNNIDDRYVHVSTSIYMCFFHQFFCTCNISHSRYCYLNASCFCNHKCSLRRKNDETGLNCHILIVHRMGSVLFLSNSYHLLNIITKFSCKFIVHIQSKHWV